MATLILQESAALFEAFDWETTRVMAINLPFLSIHLKTVPEPRFV